MKNIFNFHSIKTVILFGVEFGCAFGCAASGYLGLYIVLGIAAALIMRFEGLR